MLKVSPYIQRYETGDGGSNKKYVKLYVKYSNSKCKLYQYKCKIYICITVSDLYRPIHSKWIDYFVSKLLNKES